MNATVGDLQAERLVAFGIDNCRSAVTAVILDNGHVFDAMNEPQRRRNMYALLRIVCVLAAGHLACVGSRPLGLAQDWRQVPDLGVEAAMTCLLDSWSQGPGLPGSASPVGTSSAAGAGV